MTPDVTGNAVVDALLVWGSASVALGELGRRGARFVRRAGHVLDDVRGEPARPGVAARPGLMERIGAMEQDLSAVKHEVFPNNGESLRDAVNRIDQRTAWIDAAGDGGTGP